MDEQTEILTTVEKLIADVRASLDAPVTVRKLYKAAQGSKGSVRRILMITITSIRFLDDAAAKIPLAIRAFKDSQDRVKRRLEAIEYDRKAREAWKMRNK